MEEFYDNNQGADEKHLNEKGHLVEEISNGVTNDKFAYADKLNNWA